MTTERNSTLLRKCWWAAFLLLAAPLVFRCMTLLSRNVDTITSVIDYLYDDAYYYLAIAANLADTGRTSLDGLTATNGYQPLWLIALALDAKLTGTEPWRFFVACCLLTYGLAMGTMLL